MYVAFLKRAFMFLEDGDWQRADEYFEKVLDIDPECAEAYLGKLMIELKIQKQEELKNQAHSFENNIYYQKACRFGNTVLPQYVAYIKDADKKYKQKVDNIAKAIIDHSNSVSFEKHEKQLKKEIASLEKRAVEIPEINKRVSESIHRHEEASKISKEINKLFDQREALVSEKASLGLFNRREKMVINEQLSEVDEKIEKLKSERRDLYDKDKEYEDKYGTESYQDISRVESLIDEKKKALDKLISVSAINSDSSITYEDAWKEFSSDISLKIAVLGSYPDLQKITKDKPGGKILFGKFKSAPIEWRALTKENGKVLLVSEYALDCQQYGSGVSLVDNDWYHCSLRKWLNSFFLGCFFGGEEKLIATTDTSDCKNPEHGTKNSCSHTTTDKVFLLNINEAEKYLTTDESRKCAPTAYAKEKGAWTDVEKTANGDAACCWWLRSSGGWSADHPIRVSYVNSDGSIDFDGFDVKEDGICVRPALWINLDS